MTKNAFFILVSLLIAGVLVYFVFEKIGAREIWQAFLSFSPRGIFWALTLTTLSVLLNAWRWQIILKDRGYNLSLSDLTPAWIAGFAIAYFTPVAMLGDEVIKTYILKNKFSIPLRKATVSVFLEDMILDGSVFFLTIFVGIIFFILRTMVIPLRLWMVIVILSFPVGGLGFFYFKAFKTESMVKIIEQPLKKLLNSKIANGIGSSEKEILNFFKVQNKNMWRAIIISFFKGIINVIRSWVIILFLGIKIDVIAALSVVAFTNIAYIFPLPAALGSLEVLQTFAFTNLGLTPQIAVAFTLILRAFDTLVALSGIFFVFRFGTKFIKEKMGL